MPSHDPASGLPRRAAAATARPGKGGSSFDPVAKPRHGDPGLSCSLCHKTYSRSDVLSRHLVQAHGQRAKRAGRPRKTNDLRPHQYQQLAAVHGAQYGPQHAVPEEQRPGPGADPPTRRWTRQQLAASVAASGRLSHASPGAAYDGGAAPHSHHAGMVAPDPGTGNDSRMAATGGQCASGNISDGGDSRAVLGPPSARLEWEMLSSQLGGLDAGASAAAQPQHPQHPQQTPHAQQPRLPPQLSHPTPQPHHHHPHPQQHPPPPPPPPPPPTFEGASSFIDLGVTADALQDVFFFSTSDQWLGQPMAVPSAFDWGFTDVDTDIFEAIGAHPQQSLENNDNALSGGFLVPDRNSEIVRALKAEEVDGQPNTGDLPNGSPEDSAWPTVYNPKTPVDPVDLPASRPGTPTGALLRMEGGPAPGTAGNPDSANGANGAAANSSGPSHAAAAPSNGNGHSDGATNSENSSTNHNNSSSSSSSNNNSSNSSSNSNSSNSSNNNNTAATGNAANASIRIVGPSQATTASVNAQARKSMQILAEYAHQNVWPLPGLANFPSTKSLTVCVNLYLANFAAWLPIVDSPRLSFRVDKAAPIVLMAMASIGSVYGSGGVERLAFPLDELVRRQIVYICEHDHRFVLEPCVMQASLLQSFFGLYSGSPRLFHHAEISRASLVTACRRMHLLHADYSATKELKRRNPAAPLAELRKAMQQDHRYSRLGWAIFLFDSQLFCFYGAPCHYALFDIQVSLPVAAPASPGDRLSERVTFAQLMEGLLDHGQLLEEPSDMGLSCLAYALYRLCLESAPGACRSFSQHASVPQYPHHPQKLLDQLARHVTDTPASLTALRLSCVALAHHSYLQLTDFGLLSKIKVAAGRSGEHEQQDAAQRNVAARLRADPAGARCLFAHAAMLRCLLNRFTFDTPTEVIWTFDAALAMWAFLRFSGQSLDASPADPRELTAFGERGATSELPEMHGVNGMDGMGGMDGMNGMGGMGGVNVHVGEIGEPAAAAASTVHHALTWKPSPQLDEWIRWGKGRVSVQGIGSGSSITSAAVLKSASERLEVMSWGLASKYRSVLNDLVPAV